MKAFWIGLILSLVSLGMQAQERLLFTHSCNYNGEISPVEDLYGFASDTEAEDAMRRIMRYTGLPSNFTIKAANVPNAAAVLYQEERFILYNQYFMLRIKDQTRTDWAALSILAHEIGHHLSGHTLDSQGSRPDKELEADKFSGYVLYKMGATLEEARVAMEALASETGTATHPPRSARLAAVTNGWLEAEQQNAIVKPIDNKPVDNRPKVPETKAPGLATKGSATFKKTWVEEQVEEKGLKGIRIHSHFNVSNLFGQNCRAVVWFYDTETGEPLEDFNGQYSTSSGDVSVGMDFVPNYISTDFTDFPLFIPYEELHLGPGLHNVKFQIGLFHRLAGGQLQQVGSVSPFYTFVYEAAVPSPEVSYRDMWVDYGVYESGRQGLRVHLKFNVQHMKGKPCRAEVLFSQVSGLPLTDQNGRYATSEGKVAVTADFSPQYDSSDFNDLVMFIPYDELHLPSGKHMLKLNAGLYYGEDGQFELLGEGFPEHSFTLSK